MKIALCCIAKLEDEYLKEWCDYHLKLGFSDIFVYQNDWRYERGDITDKRVHMLVLDGNQKQNECYNQFIIENHRKFDYCLFIDCDEFLVLYNKTLEQYLNGIKHCPNIYINWRIFGDNGLKGPVDGDYSQLKRFTRCDEKLHRLGKNIINFNVSGTSILFNNPHILVYNSPNIIVPQYYDSNGDKIEFYPPWDKVNGNSKNAELFHYRNKTYDERFKKHGVGCKDAFWENNPYDSLDFFNKTFEEYNTNDVVNTYARDFMYGNDRQH